MTPALHVTPHVKGGWRVTMSGSARAIYVCSTKADAVKHGRALAKRDVAPLFIHRCDGTIQTKVQPSQSRQALKSQC